MRRLERLKQSIIGSYHQVSAKHLDAYLAELEFRFYNRENPYMLRHAMLMQQPTETLLYAKLIADQRAFTNSSVLNPDSAMRLRRVPGFISFLSGTVSGARPAHFILT